MIYWYFFIVYQYRTMSGLVDTSKSVYDLAKTLKTVGLAPSLMSSPPLGSVNPNTTMPYSGCQTNINNTTAIYGTGGGGGVPPAGISTNVVGAASGTTLTLEVTAGQPFVVLDSQLSTIFLAAPTIDTTAGNLVVSSINGGAYPPSGAGYPLISTIIPQSGVSFTNVSTNSGFVTTEAVDMKAINEYLVSGEVVFSIGDNTSGLSIQGASGLIYGAAVMQSNQTGASFSFNARPTGTDSTVSFLIATTSATPASGTLRNLVVTNLGVRGGNL